MKYFGSVSWNSLSMRIRHPVWYKVLLPKSHLSYPEKKSFHRTLKIFIMTNIITTLEVKSENVKWVFNFSKFILYISCLYVPRAWNRGHSKSIRSWFSTPYDQKKSDDQARRSKFGEWGQGVSLGSKCLVEPGMKGRGKQEFLLSVLTREAAGSYLD